MTADETWKAGLAQLDAHLARLRQLSEDRAASNIRMAEQTEVLRRNLQARMDALKQARPRRGDSGNDEGKGFTK